MRVSFILFCFLFCYSVSNATDTTGRWVGTMEHKGIGVNKTVWYCDLNLTISGDRCTGTISYSFMQRNSPLILKVKFNGDVLDNTIVIQYFSKDVKKSGPEAKSILLQFRYKLILVKNKFTNTVSGDYVGFSKGLIPDKTKGYIYLEPFKPEYEEVIVKKMDMRIDSLIAAKDNPPPPPQVSYPYSSTVKTEQPDTKKQEQTITKNKEATIKVPRDTITTAQPVILKLDTTLFSDAKAEVRTKLKARENIVTEKMMLDTGEVTVELYDNGEIDGDVITVIHNKEIALSNTGLTDKALRFSFQVDLKNPYHEIVMYAENQGRIPPNTALMIITFGNQRKQVFLSADDKKSAVVLLELKKNN
ncbi:MAG TPA: hypothetical protein VFN30_14415 [Chitinophagaceae bacterium]|nr:hypothetical protein [Chitinophagaceae bacterium]